jgi:hypothetical protein
MSKEFVSLTQYLNGSEMEKLRGHLEHAKIICFINEHGPHAGKRQNFYYEIKVSSDQYYQAKKIFRDFKESQRIENQRCPKCRSLDWEPVPKLNFLQKIIYIGTTPVRCKDCKTKYIL